VEAAQVAPEIIRRDHTTPLLMLNMGCGSLRMEGFVNIDCRETATTDVVAPAWDLGNFQDESVGYVYARHMLEHLTIDEAARALAEWRRVLCEGGIVHVVVPDLLFHARQLLGQAECPGWVDRQHAHAMAGIYGWQRPDHGGEGEDAHRWGYTPATLERLLVASGFAVTDDGIDQLTERDREPWHINMRGVK